VCLPGYGAFKAGENIFLNILLEKVEYTDVLQTWGVTPPGFFWFHPQTFG
jgi:hypothetical protein